MLNAQDAAVRKLLFAGNFGLEKENLRITPQGYFAHTPHPFGGHPHIERDFCENQTEINTPVRPSAQAALACLLGYTRDIQRALAALPEPELLWPFSNPPYIRSEEDIPIAQFTGPLAQKTEYRRRLSGRYGRYTMALCGIHVNYSFAEELLRAGFAADGGPDYRRYKDRLYLDLAEHLAAYGWLLTALTAASPLLDTSYVEKGRCGGAVFNGMASTRGSELGYWNHFTPILDYGDVCAYAASVQRYVNSGLLVAPSELYYPIRLKPRGAYDLHALCAQGIDHIELRMVDLNPLAPAGLEERDLLFIQLLLVWLACCPRQPLGGCEQVQAVQNFKNAAHYDLKTVKILAPGGRAYTVAEAGCMVLARMRGFYAGQPAWVQAVLAFEEEKFTDPYTRYAWRVRAQYAGEFVQRGLAGLKAPQPL